jgi:hypothetical protein
MIIQRIEPVSCAKMLGVLYGALGFIFGAFASVFFILGSALASARPEMAGRGGAAFGLIGGIAAIVLGPLLYGAMGFLFGFLGAWLYNLIASKTGGIKVDMLPDTAALQPLA